MMAAAPGGTSRQQPISGLSRHLEGLLTCSICISTFVDPLVTPCGHAFCYACISRHLAAGEQEVGQDRQDRHVCEKRREVADTVSAVLCPQCAAPLRRDQLNPCFALNAVVKHVSQMRLHANQEQGPYLSLKHMVNSNKEYLSSKELSLLSKQLLECKQEAERKEKAGTLNLLLHFLHQSKEEKASRLEALQKEIECLDADILACGEIGAEGLEGGDVHCAVKEEKRRAAVVAPGGSAMAVAPGISGAHGIDAEREAEKNRKDEDESELELEDEARARSRWGRQSLSRRGQAMGQTHVPPSKPHIASSQHLEPLERHHQRTSETADTTHGNDGGKGPVELLCSNKRRRIASQFEDLQSVYLQLRSSRHGNGTGDAEEGCVRPDQSPDAAIDSTSVDRIMTSSASSSGLRQFSKILGTLAHANRLRILAEIPRPPIRNQSSIISSVEYDRNGKFFATAGVSKRISVFDHTNTVVNAMRGLPIAHCPIVEMVTRSKLSCISWNKFISSELASSDYEGVLNVWDSSTGNLVHEYEAHSKRIWSVDFCCADPKLLVTGSDDSFVKVWSTRSPSAISQFDVKANVCAVKWHPTQPHTVAIGAADHNVYIYDMRKYDTSMSSFSGHKKAVSYVRWASDDEIVSASTDCTLRLWNTQRAELLGGACAREERTYRGHVNERNFVGLAVSNDFIVCGSETHEVYTYYKPLSKPITKIALPVAGGAGGPLGRGQARERPFVSALSWHPAKKELLTATSQGSVFVLSLEGELDDTRE